MTNGTAWHLVYDLARDAEQVKRIQHASLTKPGFGFPVEPALFGSSEWWRLIDRGVLHATEQEGVIRRVYWGSMGDWPEFAVATADGTEATWTREGDVRRYVEGMRARVRFLELRGKPDAPIEPDRLRKVTLQIWVEESNRRSPAVAPGPGGHGLVLAGGPGTALHYILAPYDNPKRLLRAIVRRRMTATARPWFMGGTRVTAKQTNATPLVHENARAVAEIARDRGGTYEGYDLIEDGSCRAEGPTA